MYMMIMKKATSEAFRSPMFEKITTAKEFLIETEKKFVKNKKVKISMLLENLISIRYKGKGTKKKNNKRNNKRN